MLGLAQTELPNRRLEVATALWRLRSDEVRTPSCAVMPMLTTTIGAYPKPAYVRLPDWFAQPGGTPIADSTKDWAGAMAALGRDPEPILARGVRSAVGDQVEAGIDIPTDGEIIRENHIHYHCRHLDGVTFDRLEEKALRNLAGALDEAEIDAVSIEDAHRPNDLSLLEAFSRSTVILGVVAIAKSRVEPTREIRERLRDALAYIDPLRLIAAPDCGLGLLGRDLARKKLTNLCRAAAAVGGG